MPSQSSLALPNSVVRAKTSSVTEEVVRVPTPAPPPQAQLKAKVKDNKLMHKVLFKSRALEGTPRQEDLMCSIRHQVENTATNLSWKPKDHNVVRAEDITTDLAKSSINNVDVEKQKRRAVMRTCSIKPLDVGRTSNQESLFRSIQFSKPISDQLLTGDTLEPGSELSLASPVEERVEGSLNSGNASVNSWLQFRPMDTPPKSELFGVMGTYMKKQNSLAEEAANMARANAVGKHTYFRRLEHRERASSLKYITSKYLEHMASK